MMSGNQTDKRGMGAARLYEMGLVVVAVSALLYLWSARYGSSGIIIGGVSMTVGMMSRALLMRSADARTRRLDRMALLGGLGYIVAGGFGLQGGNEWMVIFTIATIFTAYGIFVRKEEKRKS